MKRQSSGPILSAVFVDYDNIYLSLKRKSEEAAKRFAKDALSWVKEIETGRLITPTNSYGNDVDRRIVMNRCYGNPVPRRNSSDNSTDMNSFPFVRHHFLRAGFEIVDCPPLTAQLKNSSDIRMVMDVRDYLTHDTYFDEFVILSGDADFTPVLHRLRAHARRTVIFANDYTAAPYTAISDGEVREADLINLLLEGKLPGHKEGDEPAVITASAQNETVAHAIIAEVVAGVRSSPMPLPLEALADRALRTLGHDKTIGTNWAGAGSFRELLLKGLPEEIRLTDQPPYLAFEVRRAIPAEQVVTERRPIAAESRGEMRGEARHDAQHDHGTNVRAEQRTAAPRSEGRLEIRDDRDRTERPAPELRASLLAPQPAARQPQPAAHTQAQLRDIDTVPVQAPVRRPAIDARLQSTAAAPLPPAFAPPAARAQQPAQPTSQQAPRAPEARAPERRAVEAPAPDARASEQRAEPRAAEQTSTLQQSIARIHDASQAPPLSPPEYRVLFAAMAQEITEQGLLGAQTLTNISLRARESGMDIRRDDVRFVLEVVSEPDPWFEQGASANLFSSRFRNFVVARCRGEGLSLSADEIDLIDAWFAGAPSQAASAQQQSNLPAVTKPAARQAEAAQRAAAPAQSQAPSANQGYQQDRWWTNEEARQQGASPQPQQGYGRAATPQQSNDFGSSDNDFGATEEFPRIVKNRLRG
jgi:NYN domain